MPFKDEGTETERVHKTCPGLLVSDFGSPDQCSSVAIHSLSEATELQAEHLGLVWEEDEAPWAAKHMPLAMFVLHENSGVPNAWRMPAVLSWSVIIRGGGA